MDDRPNQNKYINSIDITFSLFLSNTNNRNVPIDSYKDDVFQAVPTV